MTIVLINTDNGKVLKRLVTGPCLSVNCYFQIDFHKIIRAIPSS